jgi:hypothetical protein
MEYGEPINESASEQALIIALERFAEGGADLRGIAAEAVSRAYCTCVTHGGDALEDGLSKIHRDLINDLEHWLRLAAEREAD